MNPGVAPSAQPSAPAPKTSRNPWSWIPTLYFAEGLPYVVVMTVAVIMYKGLGLSNTDIALYTSWLYLPWVIKPLWSPVVDILKTRRMWIWVMQIIIGGGLAGVALTIPTTNFVQYTLAFLWLLAFSSATHDIAADGFYMLATTEGEQAFFVGIRSTFYRLAMISGQGLLVIFAGLIQSHTGLPKVELHVAATPNAAIVQAIETNAAWFVSPSPAVPNLVVVPQAEKIEIRPEARSKKEITDLIATAKSRNTANGFYRKEGKKEEQSWLSHFFRTLGTPFRAIGGKLEPWLRDHFGATRSKSDIAGNIGALQLQLSRKPEKEVVVTLGLKSGDKSVALAEGSRLIFSPENWNKPALVIFQLDPKLRATSSAVFEIRSGNIALSWTLTFFLLAALFLFFGIYHRFILPRPVADKPGDTNSIPKFFTEFFSTFGSYFSKPKILLLLLFLLFYRFAEAQLVKMVIPFLVDGREVGGLGLTTGQVGFVYGTVGIIALTCGGLLGGFLASRYGLKTMLWPMVLIMHLPDAMFIYLSYAQPGNIAVISSCVAIEQFGYGFGFTAYMLYMIYIARGKHETAHYAICTGFMAMGMMFPGMWSGWLQEIIGYQHFFVWVMLATIPGFVVAALVPLDRDFGKKKRE
jgi:MFS transporter, PAT family, beta-lactamase induction signal transducer AmpG